MQPGDIYLRETLVYDGYVYDWVQCDLCRSMTSDVIDWASYVDEGVSVEDYAEWVSEHPDDPRAIEWNNRCQHRA